MKNILGMLLAVVGMIIYSWAVESEKQAKMSSHVSGESLAQEEDVKLLKERVNRITESDLELGQAKS